MLGHDTDDGGGELVWGDIPCEFCLEDPRIGPLNTKPFIGPARWAVVVKDCCRGDAAVDYLICEGHWTLYRAHLVGTCDGCGKDASHYTDSVWAVEPIGAIPVGIIGFRKRRHRWTLRRRS